MARSFASASSQYLRKTAISVTGDFTLQLWGKATDATPTARKVLICLSTGTSLSNYAWLSLRPSGAIETRIDNGLSIDTSGTAVDNTWFQAACTVTATTAISYINGGNSTSGSGGADSENTRISVAVNQSSSYYFDGDIAYTAIWNCALSAAEVATLYNGGLGMDPRYVRLSNLVACWPLIHNDIDYISGYNLTAYNDPTFVDFSLIFPKNRSYGSKGAV